MKRAKEYLESLYEKYLLRQCRHVPKHIAIIQDGNRRFARESGIEVALGHRLGAEKTETVMDWAHDIGVTHMTLYCFSTENFRRTKDELGELFTLFTEKAIGIVSDERVHKNKIKFQMVGDRNLLPKDFLEKIERVERITKDYDHFTINLAIAYGGRNEIVLAAKSILQEARKGTISPEEIDIKTIEAHLYREQTIPPVDLIIRTGNDKRTSNFLPWLANGNESAVYFCAPYWPMFRKIDLLRGIRMYDQRIKNDPSYFP